MKMEETHVPIHDEDVFWRIHAIEVEMSKDKRPAGGGRVIQLEWGWTAGMSEEDRKNYAEDAPDWKYSVKTTIDMAKMLRDELDELINKYEEK